MSDALPGPLVESIERIRRVHEAAKALCEKLRAVHADTAYQAVWISFMLHGSVYQGPNYRLELEALEKALQEVQS